MYNNNLIDQFIELVQIDSPSGEESDVQKYLVNRFSELGFKCVVDNAGNIIAKNMALGEPVLVGAHMDTVEPGRGITPQIKDGVIYSRDNTILGADNKATIAAILSGIKKAKVTRALEIVITVREETDGGINEIDFSKIRSKTGIIADSVSPIGTIVMSSPWIEDMEITISGQAAHASQPERGINALFIAAKAISTMPLGQINENTISNIGLVNGGDATNTIPSKVYLKGEIRSFDEKDFEKTKLEIEKHFRNVSASYKANAAVKHLFYGNGYTHDRKSQAIEDVLKIYKKLGISPNFIESYGASDANIYINRGIKVVNIGDGVEDAHTRDEKISIKNLEKLSNIFTNYFSVK